MKARFSSIPEYIIKVIYHFQPMLTSGKPPVNIRKTILCILLSRINPFSTNVSLLYPQKTSENLRFSDVFRGCRSGTLIENGLINVENSFQLLFSSALKIWACVVVFIVNFEHIWCSIYNINLDPFLLTSSIFQGCQTLINQAIVMLILR